ncbi:MAG: hypothetical protein R3D25_00910, partial [Geminicoccaceae bacterium]
ASEELGWRPRLDTAAAVDWTAEGYRRLEAEASGRFIFDQIERFSDLRPVGDAVARARPATGQPSDAHAHA